MEGNSSLSPISKPDLKTDIQEVEDAFQISNLEQDIASPTSGNSIEMSFFSQHSILDRRGSPISIESRAGFSVHLKDRVLALNTSLKEHRPRIRSASILMIPGEQPTFQESVVYEGYHMRLWMDPRSKMATLLIESGISKTQWGEFYPPQHHEGTGGFGFLFSDIKQFISDSFPNQNARMIFQDKNFGIYDTPGNTDVDIELINDELIFNLMEPKIGTKITDEGEEKVEYTPFEECEVIIDGQDKPLMQLGIWFFYDWGKANKNIYFPLFNLTISGESSEVEETLSNVAKLFNKPRNYPYNLVLSSGQ